MRARHLLQAVLVGALSAHAGASAAAPVIAVYKSEHCGCCHEWMTHLEANGFKVKAQNVTDPSDYRRNFGIPNDLGSCHTGYVNGYALEGHVPAPEITRLLAERPRAKGLAVPAMPMGSPGMAGPRRDPYDVLLVQPGGIHAVYKHYN